MPRKSNQTEYDDMMSVFKQSPISSETRRRHRTHAGHPTRAVDPRPVNAPRSHPPHPPQTPVRSAEIFPASPGQCSGAVSPVEAGSPVSPSPLYTGLSTIPNDPYLFGNSAYQVMQSFDATSPLSTASQPLAGPSHPPKSNTRYWMVLVIYNGQQDKRPLLIQKFHLPQTQCVCGAHIRVLHLPSMVDVPPNWQVIGILWNFRKPGSNEWVEGVVSNDCASYTRCPTCQAQFCLYGPYS
ncbi:hypothetical protein DFH11DRAFT_1540850 [Phellopilus nigrolimitatus]|nr:hypothetical protein DFH11DRAFT_1540850 [Phellopilus nigrolimitatus]